MPLGRPPTPISLRLSSKTRKADSGCLEFTGSRNEKGYGKIYDLANRRYAKAHRVAWELANGPIPDGMYVCHKCDNPCCVNPEHLFIGTAKDNARDMWAKGRAHDNSGHLTLQRGNRFAAKLTEGQVRMIREKAEGGATTKDLAKEFNTHPVNVRLIVRGKTWRGV